MIFFFFKKKENTSLHTSDLSLRSAQTPANLTVTSN